jgi:hypothetical protein
MWEEGGPTTKFLTKWQNEGIFSLNFFSVLCLKKGEFRRDEGRFAGISRG